MKTTVEIPDSLYRQIKARAALKGQSVKDFLIEAVRAKLAGEKAKPKGKTGWESVYGAADPEEVAEVQRIIDEEFSRIDPEGWQ
jgi:plasmid stability protein